MKKSIWKFPIKIEDEQSVLMPKDSELLSVQVQHGQICIWALVNIEAITVKRIIKMAGTGHDLTNRVPLGPFLGTVQVNGGQFIFHVFDGGEK